MRSASREPEQAQLYPRFIIGISDKIVIRHQTSFTEEMGRVDHWRNVSRKSAQSRKYGTQCRFGFSKFPSWKTLISKPSKLIEDDDTEILKKCEGTLIKVK